MIKLKGNDESCDSYNNDSLIRSQPTQCGQHGSANVLLAQILLPLLRGMWFSARFRSPNRHYKDSLLMKYSEVHSWIPTWKSSQEVGCIEVC
jgi:hypothetical protein